MDRNVVEEPQKSKLITDNKNNPKFLFSTIDCLLNPVFNESSSMSSNLRCEEIAVYFRDVCKKKKKSSTCIDPK